MKKMQFTPGSPLISQITTVLEGGQWTNPKEDSRTTMLLSEGKFITLGTLSDTGKAIFTLMQHKNEECVKKQDAINALPEETQTRDGMRFTFFSPLGGLGFSMDTMFFRDDNQSDEQSIYDTVANGYLTRAQLQHQLTTLICETEALGMMLNAEIYHSIAPGTVNKQLELHSDFTILSCKCGTKKLKENEALFNDALTKLLTTHHVVTLPDTHALVQTYITTMHKVSDEYAICPSGIIPDLSFEESTTVYFPKDLADSGMYEDQRFQTGNDNDAIDAHALKAEVTTLFENMLAEGTAYVPEAVAAENTTTV